MTTVLPAADRPAVQAAIDALTERLALPIVEASLHLTGMYERRRDELQQLLDARDPHTAAKPSRTQGSHR